MQPFKVLKLSVKNGLNNYSIDIQGYGLIMKKTVSDLKIKFDNNLSDEIYLNGIESMLNISFSKLYISCNPHDSEIEIYILLQKMYIDTEINYDKKEKTFNFINENNNNLVLRGNDYDYREITETTIFTRNKENSLIYVEVTGDTKNWQIITEIKKDNKTISKEFPEFKLQNNALQMNLNSILFNKINMNANPLKIYVEYNI